METRHLSSVVFVALVAVALAATAGVAQANSGSVDDVDMINREDADGDGYISSFQVRVDADTDFDGFGIGKGNPILIVDVRTNHGMHRSVVRDEGVGRDQSGTWIYDIDGSDVKDLVKTSGPTEVYSIIVRMYDENKGPGIFGINDPVDDLGLVVSDNNRLENPGQDQMGTLRIESNPGNTEVRIDGDLEGETPLDVELPVDVGKREGRMTVKVNKEGYEPASRSGRIAPPDTYSFNLNEIQKPIVVSSNPSDATVYVDGNRVGKTPWTGDYWVQDSLDIRVEKSGYPDRTREDVSPEASIHFDLTSDDSSSDGSSGGSSGGGVLQDPVLQDPQIQDLYVPELDRLPELQSFITANFTHSPAKALTGQNVEFNASNSFSLGMSIDSYSWDFDDGSTASGRVVTHSFSDDGSYDVELEIRSPNGNTSTETKSIRVENEVPNARFTPSKFRVNVSESVEFDASSSNDPDGNLAGYSWSLGDGSSRSGQTVTHSYGSTGTYTVELTVTDDDGETDKANTQIEVLRPPTAAFTVSGSQASVGESVQFDASGSNDPDGSITAYQWDFGDGSFAGGQTTSHTYNSTGTYTVELGIQDDDARTDVTTRQIQVTSAGSEGDDGSGGGDTESSDFGGTDEGDSDDESSDTGSGDDDGTTDSSDTQTSEDQANEDHPDDSQTGDDQSEEDQSGEDQGIVEAIIDSILDFF